MKKAILSAVAACALTTSSVIAQSAFAQTSTPPTTPPTETMTPTLSTAPTRAPLTLSDADAKKWIDKTVYSSEGKNLGEVAEFKRDATGAVVEMHADLGGFLGLGETRVRVLPTQFHTDGDRVVLHVTSDEANSLPKVSK